MDHDLRKSSHDAMQDLLNQEFVAFDLETTGLSSTNDRIVEIGAVRFDAKGTILEEFERLVNPMRASGAMARLVHGIPDEQLALAETASVVLPEFLDFLGDSATTTLLAHNATFDAGFLGRELGRLGRAMPAHSVVDTLAMARKRWPHLKTHRLDFLARWLELDASGPHRALADSRRVKGLWLALVQDETNDSIEPPLAYPIFDPASPLPAPLGWGWVEQAIQCDQTIRIEYTGGTRGLTPREITPRGFSNRGGVAYLVALCHIESKEKEFRLDRVKSHALVGPSQ